MNTKKRKLNRGLDALLGTDLTKKAVAGAVEASEAASGDGDLRQLPLEFLQRGKYQPRIDFDELALQELADSIRAQGVMQPIVVRSVGADRYEIVAGERRWRASQLAALDTIPAIIRDISDETAIAMALIETSSEKTLIR